MALPIRVRRSLSTSSGFTSAFLAKMSICTASYSARTRHSLEIKELGDLLVEAPLGTDDADAEDAGLFGVIVLGAGQLLAEVAGPVQELVASDFVLDFAGAAEQDIGQVVADAAPFGRFQVVAVVGNPGVGVLLRLGDIGRLGRGRGIEHDAHLEEEGQPLAGGGGRLRPRQHLVQLPDRRARCAVQVIAEAQPGPGLPGRRSGSSGRHP